MLHTAPTPHGYAVVDDGDGAEALNRWDQRGGAIQLPFTDIVMPGGTSGDGPGTRLSGW